MVGDEGSETEDRDLEDLYDIVKDFEGIYEMTDSVLQWVDTQDM